MCCSECILFSQSHVGHKIERLAGLRENFEGQLKGLHKALSSLKQRFHLKLGFNTDSLRAQVWLNQD